MDSTGEALQQGNEDDHHKQQQQHCKPQQPPQPSQGAAVVDVVSAALVFSVALARGLSSRSVRLPPTYIGVRRVRPSSALVRSALKGTITTSDDDIHKATPLLLSAPAAGAATVSNKTLDEQEKLPPLGSSDAAPVASTPEGSSAAVTTNAANSPVTFKLVDPVTGQERRMTSKEKKLTKRAIRLQQRELREQKQQAKARWQQQQQHDQRDQRKRQRLDNEGINKDDGVRSQGGDSTLRISNTALTMNGLDDDDDIHDDVVMGGKEEEDDDDDEPGIEHQGIYVPLTMTPSALEQELADLRGEREGVPPVAIMPCLARIALGGSNGGGTRGGDGGPIHAILDDELAQTWATLLKQHMQPAERVRHQEALRPMPYQLVPEVWNRMRPSNVGQTTTLATTTRAVDCAAEQHPLDPYNNQHQPQQGWSYCTLRPRTSKDAVAEAVAQILHAGTDLHISCGAKFGCDFLCYDGPRVERHAFCGVRVESPSHNTTTTITQEPSLPLPNAYNLAGYVRCLNTAGKLALLATAVLSSSSKSNEDQAIYRVAIVDLALEKVTTSARKQRSTANLQKK